MISYNELADKKISIKAGITPGWALLPAFGQKDLSVFLPYRLGIIHEPLAESFRQQGIKRAIYIGMPFWQMEAVYHDTCRQVKIPDVNGSIYNPRLFLELLKELKTEVVVTVPKILPLLFALREDYPDFKNHVRLWYFIDGHLSPESAVFIRQWTPDALTVQSFGPFPPIPSAEQCEFLSAEGKINFFHPCPGHKIEIEDGEIIVSSPLDAFYPFNGYRTNIVGRFTKKNCPCGRKELLELTEKIYHDRRNIR